MGTYGVTHVKKDDKVVTFSDSYDGYMGGGMGQANLLCIKYLSTPILRSLFDEFSASTKVPVKDLASFREDSDDDSDDLEITQRQIDDVLYRIKEQTNNPEAVAWMESILKFDVRASSSGFATLLYLNINNHYGRDYSYSDYTVDLDTEEFVIGSARIPFEKIRNASLNALDAFCSNIKELLPKDIVLDEQFYLFDYDFIGKNPEKFNMIMDAYLNLEPSVVDAYYKKAEEERQAYMAKAKGNGELYIGMDMQDENDTMSDGEYIGGYSVHNAQVTGGMVRTIKALVERLKAVVPESEFLVKNSDWGTNEDYSEGGFRIFSPMNSGVQHKIHEDFVAILENSFKVRFNIFSSSGKWSSDVKAEEGSGVSSFFAEVVPGPEKSLFSLKEIAEQFQENQEEMDLVFKNVNPYLSIHGDFQEVRNLILNKNSNDELATPFIWLQVALLYRDKDVFNAVYPSAQELMSKQEDNVVSMVKSKYLKSLADSESIHRIVGDFAQKYGKTYVAADGFIEHLKQKGFFNELEAEMNASEKAKYAIQSTGEKTSKNKKFK